MILQFNNLSKKKCLNPTKVFFRDNLLSMIPDNNNRIMSHNNVTVENHRFKSWFDLKCIGRLPQNALLQKRSKWPKMVKCGNDDNLNGTSELGNDLSLDNTSEYGDKDHEMAF